MQRIPEAQSYGGRMKAYAWLAGTVVVVAGLGLAFVTIGSEKSVPAAASSQPAAAVSPEMSGTRHENARYAFSFGVPEGFVVTEPAPDEGGDTILIERGGDGIQILIMPFSDIPELTADMIRADIPDMTVSDVQTVEIGEGYRGVAFMSDNESFGGASREVWFVFRGHLYQISTYARLDPVLQALFGTWVFAGV